MFDKLYEKCVTVISEDKSDTLEQLIAIAEKVCSEYPQKWGDCYKVNSTVAYWINDILKYFCARIWQVKVSLDREIYDDRDTGYSDSVYHVMLSFDLSDDWPEFETLYDFSDVFTGDREAEIIDGEVIDDLGGTQDKKLRSKLDLAYKKAGLNEANLKDLIKKQKTEINQLFPDFDAKVKGVAKRGGIRLKELGPTVWSFKIHSGTKDDLWYDAYLKFKNLDKYFRKFIADKNLWTSDKKKIDMRKLADKILWSADVEFTDTCKATQYWGSAYILSRPHINAKYGKKEHRRPKVRNPLEKGAYCKHIQILMQVLPFYKTTMAKWLKDFYSKEIDKIVSEFSKTKDSNGEEVKPNVKPAVKGGVKGGVKSMTQDVKSGVKDMVR